jgi:hypothetical protein
MFGIEKLNIGGQSENSQTASESPSPEELYDRAGKLPISDRESQDPESSAEGGNGGEAVAAQSKSSGAKKAAMFALAGVIGSGALAGGALASEPKVERGIKFPDGHVEIKKIGAEQLASETLKEIANNPNATEDIVKNYVRMTKNDSGLLTVKDMQRALKDLNIASSKLSVEELKGSSGKLAGIIVLTGKYEGANPNLIIEAPTSIDKADLEEAKKFIAYVKKIPDQANATTAAQNRLMKQRVVEVALAGVRSNPAKIEALKQALEEEISGQNDMVDYLKFNLHAK